MKKKIGVRWDILQQQKQQQVTWRHFSIRSTWHTYFAGNTKVIQLSKRSHNHLSAFLKKFMDPSVASTLQYTYIGSFTFCSLLCFVLQLYARRNEATKPSSGAGSSVGADSSEKEKNSNYQAKKRKKSASSPNKFWRLSLRNLASGDQKARKRQQ